MYYLLTQYRLTNSLIARLFNKDHTTVLHGIRRIKDHMETDVNFREYVERMESLLDVNFTVEVEEVKG
jgi:chromosomal replication initiation ATPase DnaA